ncbi:MAG: stage II sporulation protein M [Syntrophomonadaceae bacterium]|jgi:stage II sporulation protein M
MNLKQRIKQHIADNRWQYILLSVIFIIGLIMGNYKVLSLDGGVRSHLTGLLDTYLSQDMPGDLDSKAIFMGAFINQARMVFLIWLLGLTVIGFPLILGVIFYRGFSLGFTMGFLVHERAGAGVIITILSILPQNLIYIPFLLIWAVIGINFTAYLVRGRNVSAIPLGKGLVSYTALMVVFLVVILIGSFVEAYLSPWFLGLVL